MTQKLRIRLQGDGDLIWLEPFSPASLNGGKRAFEVVFSYTTELPPERSGVQKAKAAFAKLLEGIASVDTGLSWCTDEASRTIFFTAYLEKIK